MKTMTKKRYEHHKRMYRHLRVDRLMQGSRVPHETKKLANWLFEQDGEWHVEHDQR
jgi:hypothetical protein